MSGALRRLPAVAAVLETAGTDASVPRQTLVEAIRAELAEWRDRLRASPDDAPVPTAADVARDALARVRQAAVPRYRRVINATGIVLHTNLGRSPLHPDAVAAAARAGAGYLSLELDLNTGKRSSRQGPIRDRLAALTGAESATAVNNCAAATILVLRTLAAGREVVVSRGQLVEIGGGFRIPEIMAVSGATLVEVGTTNITRIADYARAVTPRTAALMLVHPSNYRVRGFVDAPPLAEMVALARERGIPLIDDCGSGAMLAGLGDEPVIPERLAAGSDVVLCSADKLLGGPQAGLILGRAEIVRVAESDPLMRAFRLDKLTLAALETTLAVHADPARARAELPTLRMLCRTAAELRADAEALAGLLALSPEDATVEVRESQGFAGGGSLPDEALPGWAVVVTPRRMSETSLSEALRRGVPAVLARLHAGAVWLDPRALLPGDAAELAAAVRAAIRPPAGRVGKEDAVSPEDSPCAPNGP